MSSVRRRLMAAVAAASGESLPAIGDAFMGGYFAGVIDTTKGNIIAADASQTGLRYALIIAPRSTELSRQYKSANTASPAACRTRWDGLTATAAMVAAGGNHYAAEYCASLAHPTDAASAWYLPAMDEFEVLYRNLKPATTNNSTSLVSAMTFPGGADFVSGYNPSSDPAGASYTATVPAQTTVTAFAGGAESLSARYHTATEADSAGSWTQYTSGGSTGTQASGFNIKNAFFQVRPVRRLVL